MQSISATGLSIRASNLAHRLLSGCYSLPDVEFAHRMTAPTRMARTYRAGRRLPLVVEKPQGGLND